MGNSRLGGLKSDVLGPMTFGGGPGTVGGGVVANVLTGGPGGTLGTADADKPVNLSAACLLNRNAG